MEVKETPDLCYNSDDLEFKNKLDENQKSFLKNCQPPPWLNEAEYPFKWLMSLQCYNIYKSIIIYKKSIFEKIKHYENQGPVYGFERFCYLLTLLIINSPIFDYLHNQEKSLDAIQSDEELDSVVDIDLMPRDEYTPEKVLALCADSLKEMADNAGDVMYSRIGAAMEYVLAATKAHLHYWKGDVAASQEIFKNLQLKSEMTIENQSGLEAIKGKFILCFYRDVTIAMDPMVKAKQLDSSFGAWHYWVGKIMRRHRREFRKPMTHEEIQGFRIAVELEKNPKHLVFLAQAYKEMGYTDYKKKKCGRNLNVFHTKAAELYRQSWDLQNDAVTICRRVGHGIMGLEDSCQDLALAEMALKKATDIYNNDELSQLQLGVLYYKYFKDDDSAMEYFNKAPYLGPSYIIQLKLIRDPSYDPKDMIEQLKSLKNLSRKSDKICELAWYYLFYNDNVTMSAKYAWEVLKKERKIFKLENFKSYSFCVREENLITILVNEILLLKQTESIPEHEDIHFLECFLQRVHEKLPDTLQIKPCPRLKDSMKQNIEKVIGDLRSQRYDPESRTLNTSHAGGRVKNQQNNEKIGNQAQPGKNNRFSDSFKDGKQKNVQVSRSRFDTSDNTNWRQNRKP